MPRVKDYSATRPLASSPYADRGTRGIFSDRPGSARRDGRGLIRFGADPLRFSYGDRSWIHGGHHRPYHPGYGGYYRHRPYYYPRSCYPYHGFYPWYGFGLGFGYTYSTAYFAEPYAVQVYDSPGYVVPTYGATEYVTSDPYSAPATAYGAPPVQTAPVEQVPQGADAYQTLDPSDELRAVVVDGNAAFAAGRYEEAKDLYIRAALADERDGYVKMLHAWANFALGDYDAAATSLRRALLTTTDLVDYPMDLRTLYTDQSMLATQTDRLARYVAENPENRELRLILGYVHYSVGEAQRAADIFQDIAARDPNDSLVGKLRDAAVRASRGQTPPPPRPEQPSP